MRDGTVWSSEYVWVNLDWHNFVFGFWWSNVLRFSVHVFIGPFTIHFATKRRYIRGPNDPCGMCGEFHRPGFYHNVPSTSHLR